MPIATTASIRMASDIVTMIGISGTYSSPMPIVKEPRLNIAKQPTIRIHGLWPSFSTAPCSAASIAPVLRKTSMTPPTMKIRKMMSWASARPFVIPIRKYQGGSVTDSSAVTAS